MVHHRLGRAVLAAVMIFLAIGNSAVATVATEQEPTKEQLQMVDEYVLQEMKASKIPGLALGIVHGDRIIYTKGYGVANGKKEPVTPETPFYIGSVGKTFTALAIAQLAGEGKLQGKDSIQQYIPWFTLADNSAKTITIEDLLKHTSGLSYVSGNLAYSYNGKYSLEQTVREISRREKPNRPVGKSYEYSNLNYSVLGLVVEYVSGLSYEDYVVKNIFEPMGLTDSFASKTKAVEDGLAQGYRELYGFNMPVNVAYPMGQVPSGYQLSSAADMSKYLVYYLNNGYSGGKSIIRNNILTQPKDTMAPFGSSDPYYGLDWCVTTDPSYDNYNYFYGFMGATTNFNSAMLISQAHRYGIIVLVNQRGVGRKPEQTSQIIGNGISDILLHGRIVPSVKRTFDRKQLINPIAAVLLCLMSIYSCIRFRPKLGTPKRRIAIVLSLLGSILIPGLLLIGVPVYYDNNWRYFLNAGPELGLPVFILSMVLLITGVIKLYLLSVQWQKVLRSNDGK